MIDPKYLLVVDNSFSNETVQNYFHQFGYKIIQSPALDAIESNKESLTALLINWSLIQADLNMINTLYHQHSVPIIIISDSDNEEMCVKMLEAGADDFIVKPIHPRELHARISAISRRIERANKHANNEKEMLLFANWRLCPTSRQLFNQKTERLLSAKEFDLLLAFARHPQQVMQREVLSNITRGGELNPLDRRIDVQISRLRQKIEVDAKKPVLIKTVRNYGYMLTTPVLTIKK